MSRLYTGDFDEKVTFRCSSVLLDLCKAGAAASGLDISTYIRAALWTAVPRVQQLSMNINAAREKDCKPLWGSMPAELRRAPASSGEDLERI